MTKSLDSLLAKIVFKCCDPLTEAWAWEDKKCRFCKGHAGMYPVFVHDGDCEWEQLIKYLT